MPMQIDKENNVIVGKLKIGHLSHERLGWRFIPFTTAHRSSRKNHPSKEKAIPAWVKGMARTYDKKLKALGITPGKEEPKILNERAYNFFQKAMQRPVNIGSLSSEAAWAIDKGLGILDWDGGCGHMQRGSEMCPDCKAKWEKKFK